MMKYIGLVALFWCLTTAATAQATVEVRAELENAGPTVSLFEFNGFGFTELTSTEGTDGTFMFTLPAGDPRFYYVGPATSNIAPIIVGTEPLITIKGLYGSMSNADVSTSPLNETYRDTRNQIYALNNRLQQANQAMRAAGGNATLRQAAIDDMATIDAERLALYEGLREKNPFLARIAALNTYLTFPNHGSAYANEIPYFAKTFFAKADLSDPGYNDLPWVYEAFKNYATTLSSVNLTAEEHQAYLDEQLAKIPAGSSAHRYALSGALAAMQQKNHANFVHYVDSYLAQYRDAEPTATQALEQQRKALASFVVGGEAPDFSAATPDGGEMSLSDLRGKVVLVDFWASWCGPCRRENPNVKRVYEEYKDQGFEILGVSLDNTHDRWVQAIEQDGLPWPHVSDLLGWSSGPAQLYSVRSIPHTVLLDKEGNIIARGLRGAALEQKLAEIFNKP